MVSTSGGRDWGYCTHDRNAQVRPLPSGSATDTGGPNSSGLANFFHMSKYSQREGMGRGQLRLVAAVYAASVRVMNSEVWHNPVFKMGLRQGGVSHPLTKELRDRRVPKTHGATQMHKHHTKFKNNIPR